MKEAEIELKIAEKKFKEAVPERISVYSKLLEIKQKNLQEYIKILS